MSAPRIERLLVLLEEVTAVDLALLDRQQLLEFSDALFDVAGSVEEELEHRVHPLAPREGYEVN